MIFESRHTATHRDVTAGCFTCGGSDPRWFGGQAQGTAARHHDATGHPTWCDVYMSVHYGRAAPDDRQIDIEDSIAATGSGGAARASLPATGPVSPAAPSQPERIPSP